jgi:ectoine hydroxylase-related dioxygenase (phytanoyl-CoA dioxygenase family)
VDGACPPSSDLYVRHSRDLVRNGYSILPDALPTDLCDKLVAEFGRMQATWRRSLVQEFHGRNTVRYINLLNAALIFQTIPVAEKVRGVVKAALGEDCLLGTYGSVWIGPGEAAQMIHANESLYKIERAHPTFFVNVILALSELCESNGATRLVPGSHLLDHYPVMPPVYETIAAEMPKSGALFSLGSIYHGGGANRSQMVRHGMTVAYVSGWIRPQENFQAAVSQEKAANFDPALQALIGWRTGRNLLGHIYTSPEHFSGPMAHSIAFPPSV